MHNRAVFRAVDAIYETIGNAALWPEALELISIALSAKGAAMCVHERAGNPRTYSSPALSDALREYNAQWKRQDILAQRAAMRAQANAQSNVVYTERDFATAEEIASHPYFGDFSKRYGLGSIVRGELFQPVNSPGALVVRRPLGAPPFDSDDVETFRELKRHCERSLQLAADRRQRHGPTARMVRHVDPMGLCLVLVDARGRLLPGTGLPPEWTTEALGISGGLLEPIDSASRRALRVAIAEAIECAGKANAPGPRSVLIPRTNGGRPLIAYVSPASSYRPEQHAQSHHRAEVAIAILDLAAAPAIDNDLLRSLGLTASEARIAALIGTGCSPRETADRLAIAEATVRTALKRIYAKTGTARQSELAVLLSRLALIGIRLTSS